MHVPSVPPDPGGCKDVDQEACRSMLILVRVAARMLPVFAKGNYPAKALFQMCALRCIQALHLFLIQNYCNFMNHHSNRPTESLLPWQPVGIVYLAQNAPQFCPHKS